MAKKVGPGGGSDFANQQIRNRGNEPRIHKKSSAKVQTHEGEPDVKESVQHAGVDATHDRDLRNLPPSLGGAKSPLTNLVESGWQIFAQLYGIPGNQGGLQLQIAALGGAEPAEAAFSDLNRKKAVREFVSLGFNNTQAKEIVDKLATIIAPNYMEQYPRKSSRDGKIRDEIEAFRRQLVDIGKTTTPDDRNAKIAAAGQGLLAMTGNIAGRLEGLLGKKDLPKELEVVENRVRAVYDVVKLVSNLFLGELNPLKA